MIGRVKDERPPQEAPPDRPELFVTKDRAKRLAFRLGAIAKERSGTFLGERIGMTSFTEAVPALLELEADGSAIVEAVLAGRLTDRERGETEIPFVVMLEGVLERVARVRAVEERRRAGRLAAEWAQKRVLGGLHDAIRRLEAFADVYADKRMLPVPAPAEVTHVLHRVEEDASLDRLPAMPTARAGLVGPPADRPAPAITTCADAVEDVLRAARAEVKDALPPWRVERASPTAPLVLSLGARPAAADGTAASEPAPASPWGPGPAAARTDRAASVLRLAHPISVARTRGSEGETSGVQVTIADASAVAVGSRVASGVALPPVADAAVRAYLVAAGQGQDPLAPARLVGVLGVFRVLDQELLKAFAPALEGGAARVVAGRVPHESSRKAPVHREVLAMLGAAVPGFPEHRVTEVLGSIAEGKAPAKTLSPPDVAVVLAVLGRSWPGNKPFGDRVLPLDPWSDEEVLQSVRDVVDLASIRGALDKGRDPGPSWDARFEKAAFGLLGRLARRSPA